MIPDGPAGTYSLLICWVIPKEISLNLDLGKNANSLHSSLLPCIIDLCLFSISDLLDHIYHGLKNENITLQNFTPTQQQPFLGLVIFIFSFLSYSKYILFTSSSLQCNILEISYNTCLN